MFVSMLYGVTTLSGFPVFLPVFWKHETLKVMSLYPVLSLFSLSHPLRLSVHSLNMHTFVCQPSLRC